jgi:hypothetical protein
VPFLRNPYGSRPPNIRQCDDPTYTLETVWDSGTVTLTINNINYSAYYGQGSSALSVATDLINQINAGPQYINAGYMNGAIYIAAWNQSVPTTDYPISISITYDSTDFGGPSFQAVLSGSTLIGNP